MFWGRGFNRHLGHQEITENIIPQADLVFLVTSALQPLTESEQSFIQLINRWRKRIVVIVNKCDVRVPSPSAALLRSQRD